LKTSKAGVKAYLELYSFVDDGVYIVYCPALDLSGYGYSIEEAKKSFSEVFKQHITYCINKNTLYEDLLKHGWNVRGKKSRDIKAPKLEDLLKKNEAFRDILKKTIQNSRLKLKLHRNEYPKLSNVKLLICGNSQKMRLQIY